MDVSSATDDELVEEISIRLGRGTIGYFGLLSPVQRDFQSMWTEYGSFLAKKRLEDFDNPMLAACFAEFCRIAECRDHPHGAVFAVNTTLLGREHEIAV